MEKIDSKWSIYHYTWNDLEEDVGILEAKIKSLGKKRFKTLYGVPCGGLVLATKLHYIFDWPIIFGGMDEDTLVVDDISDGMKGGVTLLPYKMRGIVTAALIYHPNSRVEPNIWLRKKVVDYVYFPWQNSPKPIRQQNLP